MFQALGLIPWRAAAELPGPGRHNNMSNLKTSMKIVALFHEKHFSNFHFYPQTCITLGNKRCDHKEVLGP